MIYEEKIVYLQRNWDKVPLSVLGKKIGESELEVCKTLRSVGISLEVKIIELQYIKENIGRMPPLVIQQTLGLTNTQFSQILQKKFGEKRYKSIDEISQEEVIAKTKWLIKDCLGWEIDDLLPRIIRTEHFKNNNLYSCLKYANYYKNLDNYYRNFSAVAYLICHAYPNIYRPFQFSYSKTNNFFSGKGGRRNYISSVMWVLENKLGIEPRNIEFLKDCQSFLRTNDLQFYGVGEFWFRQYFQTKKELVNELIKVYNVNPTQKYEDTRMLRGKLESMGISVDVCYVNGCDNNESIEIHHIFAKEDKSNLPSSLNIDMVDNLVPLCKSHHRRAQKLKWSILNIKHPEIWRDTLMEFLKVDNE